VFPQVTSGGSQVASGVACGLRGSQVASGGHKWPWGHRWPHGFAHSLGGFGWPCGVTGGHVGSWVVSGVAVDLGASQVTLITSQIFTNAPNFRIKLLKQR
jgi:hypothetical protein